MSSRISSIFYLPVLCVYFLYRRPVQEFYCLAYKVFPVHGFFFSPGDSEQAIAHVEWKNSLYPVILLSIFAVIAEEALDMGNRGIFHTSSCEMMEYLSAQDPQVICSIPVLCGDLQVYCIGFAPIKEVI